MKRSHTKSAKVAKKPTVNQLIAEIHAKLDAIEDYLGWVIRADVRFHVGQRVKFSDRAKRGHLVSKTRAGIRGTIRKIDGPFSIVVDFADRKHPLSYHHAFFNPVSGPKLF